MDLKKLSGPFDPTRISWRVGSTNGDKTSGMALAYIDARDVMARLDEACGLDGWQVRYPWSDADRLCCEIGIRIGQEWVWRSNGAGNTDVEGSKGSFSDAFKRAAVLWGIGRYLYDLPSPWVPITQAGRSYKISDDGMAELNTKLAKWQERYFKETD